MILVVAGHRIQPSLRVGRLISFGEQIGREAENAQRPLADDVQVLGESGRDLVAAIQPVRAGLAVQSAS